MSNALRRRRTQWNFAETAKRTEREREKEKRLISLLGAYYFANWNFDVRQFGWKAARAKCPLLLALYDACNYRRNLTSNARLFCHSWKLHKHTSKSELEPIIMSTKFANTFRAIVAIFSIALNSRQFSQLPNLWNNRSQCHTIWFHFYCIKCAIFIAWFFQRDIQNSSRRHCVLISYCHRLAMRCHAMRYVVMMCNMMWWWT